MWNASRLISTLAVGLALLVVSRPTTADDPADHGTPVKLGTLRGPDGQKVDLAAPRGGATALVFMSTECPISNAYSPTLNALAAEFPAAKLNLVGVCVDPDASDSDLVQHRKEYQLAFPEASDRRGSLARALGVTVTPEAVVVDDQGRLRYRGRIDDQFAARQRRNLNARTHELRDAVAAVLSGKGDGPANVEAVGCPLPEPPKTGSASVTYAGRVAAILNQNCVSCHREGQVGPFALSTYEQARKRAQDIANVVESRLMPPWKPNPAYGGPFLHDRSLTRDEIDDLIAWSEAGAPQGDPSKTPPAPTFEDDWALGTPDLIVEPAESFSIPADGDDIYRCFVIPTDLPKDVYISGIEYRPGNRRVVHHMLGYVDTTGKARELDDREPGPGYTCFSGPKIDIHGDLGGWAPGNEPSRLPEGIGRALPKGADVVVQVHYHPSGKPETDRSRIGLYFSRKPIKQTFHWTLAGDFGLRIPAHAANHESKAAMPLPVDVVAYAVTPHMHLHGSDMEIYATLPDGTRRDLVKIDDWDFGWQNTYYFKEPIDLPRGTVLHVLAHFDNSEGDKELKWGEATTDEMSIGFLGITKKGQDLTKPGEVDDLQQILERQFKELQRRAQEERRKRQQARPQEPDAR